MKTSKCQFIYRNVSKTFDRDNEKTLKVDKIEFFGNFPRNVFCAFAVTLLARPEKLDVDDHGCFVSPSCDDQSFAGRKVVLIGFFDNLHCRFLITSPTVLHHAPLKPKNCNSWLLHAPHSHHPRDVKRGRICYSFPSGLRRVKHPPQHRPPAAHLPPEPPS